MSNEDWSVQVSIKHGPNDDRGNPLYMTNVRGHTARDVRDQLADLASWSDDMAKNIAGFVATGVVRQQFPDAERLTERARPSAGKECAHGAREYKTGRSAKGDWAGWFCRETNKAAQCAVAWVD